MIAVFCTGFGCVIVPGIVVLIGATVSQSVRNSDRFSESTSTWVDWAAFAAVVVSVVVELLL